MTSLVSNTVRRRDRRRKVPMGALLATIILLPTLVFYLGWSSSLTLGSALAAVIVLLLAATRAPTTIGGHTFTPEAFTLFVVLAVMLHMLGASVANPVDLGRASASLLPLVVILLGGVAFGRFLAVSRESAVHGAAWGCFLLLCALATLPLLGIEPSVALTPGTYDKPVFPFTEPSHMALTFVPLLMYCCASSTGVHRWGALLLGAMVAGALQNLTMVVGWVLVFLICVRGFALPVVAIAIALMISQLDLSYYLNRLDFSGEVQNLSNAVYLQGWQLIDESLTNSGNWGLGFQQLGVQGSETPASQLIYTLTGGNYSNLLDGGFTFAKVVSEFGWLGQILMALYLVQAWKAVRWLRTSANGSNTESGGLLFANSVIASYLIELFVRGTGYFTGTAILLIGSLWLITGQRTEQTKRQTRAWI